MSSFPDWLFQADPKALAGALLEHRRLFAAQAGNAAAFSFTTQFTRVPLDKIFLIRTVTAEATYSAGLSASHWSVWEADGGGVLRGMVAGRQFDPAALAGGAGVSSTQDLEYVLRPGAQLRGAVVLSAAGANNAGSLTVSGWLLPRGNIQL